MHSFSFGEIALIFGIVVILFGGSRLASIGKSLGEGISNFKKGLQDSNKTDDDDVQSQSAQKNAKQMNSKESHHSSFATPVSSSYTPPQVVASTEFSKPSQSHVIDVEQKETR